MSGLAFRLLGEGIGYSASPAMMRAAFAALGASHTYELADLPAARLPGAIAGLRGAGMGGANVTTPHKRSVADLVDERFGASLQSGSVNTVVRDGRRLVGHDTDLPALAEAIERLCPGGVQRAVVLGGGGVARSVALALDAGGVSRVQAVTRSDGTWSRMEALLTDADLVLNATPIGLNGSGTPVPAVLLRADLAVLDLVYRPSPTLLVADARRAGARAAGGAGVLLGQGRRSLELWLGCLAPIGPMRDALVRELGPDADV